MFISLNVNEYRYDYFQNSILEKLHQCQHLGYSKPFLEMIFWNNQDDLFLY